MGFQGVRVFRDYTAPRDVVVPISSIVIAMSCFEQSESDEAISFFKKMFEKPKSTRAFE